MDCDRLFVLVEGDDDELFFENVIKPKIYHQVTEISYIQYSQKSLDHIENKLDKKVKSFNEVPIDAEYIFLSDRDECGSVKKKKEKLDEKYSNLDKEKILVAEVDIESWYFGGITEEVCKEFKIPHFSNTNSLGKRDFMNKLREDLYRNNNFVTSFLRRITKKFDIEECKKSNSSFEDFCNNIGV